MRDGVLAGAGLLVCAAAMAETAVQGGSSKTGTKIEFFRILDEEECWRIKFAGGR